MAVKKQKPTAPITNIIPEKHFKELERFAEILGGISAMQEEISQMEMFSHIAISVGKAEDVKAS